MISLSSIEDEVVVVKFVVQLPHANNKVTIDNILPFEGNSSKETLSVYVVLLRACTGDESESSDDEETYEDEKDTELTVVRQLGEQSVGAIGEWEKYTKVLYFTSCIFHHITVLIGNWIKVNG